VPVPDVDGGQHHRHERLLGCLEIPFRQLPAQHQCHLRREVGIRLRHRPDRKQQVRRVDGRDAAGRQPPLEHFDIAPQHGHHALADLLSIQPGATDHLHRIHARSVGLLAREFQLRLDVGAQHVLRLARVGQVRHPVQPFVQHIVQHALVQRGLGREVVHQVLLRQAGPLRDGGDGRPLVAALGEDAHRLGHDVRFQPVAVLQAPCGAGEAGCVLIHRRS